ncbi:hypothetical protein ACIRG8_15315 [Streptomyces sp. NPDC102359]|uniref:hypothetical protein n=1 Tax=unclassified Streptomyces TaxID=2593676 RepID=UPI00382FFEAE
MRRELWSHLPTADKNPVAQAVGKLRRGPGQIPKPRSGGNYRLELPASRIDALIFREGVAALDTDAPSGVVDALLGLWRGNPWERTVGLRRSAWSDVQNARDRLVEHVRALPAGRRAELTRWNRFCEFFPSEADTWRDGHPVSGPPQRRRVLIVDDMIGDALKGALGGIYDCTVVTSLSDWKKMLEGSHPLDYDCALVDRHLRESMDDQSGEIVLNDLRHLRPGLPTALMSAELPYEDAESVQDRLGVRTVIAKHNNKDGAMVPLTVLVERLIGPS